MWHDIDIETFTVDLTTSAEPEHLVRAHAVGYSGGTRLRWHAHGWHQLVYAPIGVLQVETGTGSWIVPPARAVWIPSGVRHRLTARGDVQLRTVYVGREMPGSTLPLGVVEVSPLLRELVLHLVGRGLVGAFTSADVSAVHVVLDQLRPTQVMPLELVTPTDPVACEAAARLHDEPGADLDDLARRVGASRRTLERRFRDETGVGLGRWRRRLQLVRAVELLAAGSSVSEAGWAVGYTSTSAFVAAFRRQLGTTPGRYVAST
ncbi:MAG: helix-turn-helix domain-containing protein [Acidimicrobiales bacterium]